MKPKTFDAVAASRKWREDTGRMLDAMSLQERRVYLEGLRKRFVTAADAGASCVVREEAAGGTPAPRGPGILPGACYDEALEKGMAVENRRHDHHLP